MSNGIWVGFFSALGAGLGGLVFFEVRGLGAWGSRRCVRLAARLLPSSIREEREEEWLAEWEYWRDSTVGRLLWSLGLVIAAVRLAGHERREPVSPVASSPAAKAAWFRERISLVEMYELKAKGLEIAETMPIEGKGIEGCIPRFVAHVVRRAVQRRESRD